VNHTTKPADSHHPTVREDLVGGTDTTRASRLLFRTAPERARVQPSKGHVISAFRYFFSLEVHVYASSIAANALLSFFPFTLMVLTVCQRWLHWEGAFQVAIQLLRANLPTGADFVVRNLIVLVAGHRRLQVISVAMLLFTASGIFLPLETALNKVWRIEQNRSYLRNQAVSLLLTLTVGLLALLSILVVAGAQRLLGMPVGWMNTDSRAALVWRVLLEAVLLPGIVGVYFVTYYALPNGKVPAWPVFSAALAAGLVTEIGKFVYHITLPLFQFRQVYGPFALSVTLLFWAFLGALVLLSGAHLSARIYLAHTDLQPPRENAVPRGSRTLS
jgi:YihY family inner membrane protein